MKDVANYLRNLGRYGKILDRYDNTVTDRSIWFEMVFAYWLEEAGITPVYEYLANPNNEKTVDFFVTYGGINFQMELVRVEDSDEVTKHVEVQKSSDEFSSYGLLLNSDDKNPYFKPAAQTIRLQEKILEKVEKFGVPSKNTVSLVIVDCTNIHIGRLDDEDVRTTAYGKAKCAVFQEYWNGSQIMGLFQSEYTARNAEMLRQRVSGIVFIGELKPGAMNDAFLAVNPSYDAAEQICKLPIFSCLTNVEPAL